MSEQPANVFGTSGFVESDPQEMLRQRAQHLLDLGRPAEALISTGAGLASDPEDFGLLCLHCAALGRLDRDKEAMQAAEGLIRLAPDLDTAHNLYAAYRWDAGHRDARALASARRAAELDPHDPANPLLLAHMLAHKRRPREAQVQIQAVLALDPSPGQRASALALLGQLELNARRPEAARRQAEAALAEVPGHDDAMQVLAAAQLRGSQPQEAIRTAWNAVQQDPTNPHKVAYLRSVVNVYLPYPLGLRALAWMVVPYGVGPLLFLVVAASLWAGNLRRVAALPPDLRALAAQIRPPTPLRLKRQIGLWVGYWTVFLGGLLLIPKSAGALQDWFFWGMAGLGLTLWLVLRRNLWLAIWWVYWLTLLSKLIFYSRGVETPLQDRSFVLMVVGGAGLWVWRRLHLRRLRRRA